MSFLVIGDIHVKSKILSEIEKSFEKLIELSKNQKLEFIVLLGDIYNNHERITIAELNIFHKFIMELSKISRIYILIGNHDRPKNTCFLTEEHALNPYKEYKNITVVDSTYRDGEFVFVPYVPSGKFMEALRLKMKEEELTSGKVRCIFSHQEFKGTKLGKIISRKGDVWSTDYPKIINGHIHNYDKVGNITCIGAVRQVSFDETPDKTISLFNIETLEETRIPCIISRKVEMSLSKEEMYNLKLEELSPPNQYKLIIDAQKTEMQGIIELVKDKPWITLAFRKNSVLGKERNGEKRTTYMEFLSKLLSENEREDKLFKEIFGEIVKERKVMKIVIENR